MTTIETINSSLQAQDLKESETTEISGGAAMSKMRIQSQGLNLRKSIEYKFPGILNPNAPPLGTTIEGFNFDDKGTETGFLFIPPDPIGAAGPASHIVAPSSGRNHFSSSSQVGHVAFDSDNTGGEDKCNIFV
jgi:hypothetical protein